MFNSYFDQVRIYKTCVGAVINNTVILFDIKIDLIEKHNENAMYIYLKAKPGSYSEAVLNE